MAEWAVIADRIALYTHNNADSLLLGRVGSFQVVVAKSNGYREGDIVVFAPERSILPEEIRDHYTNSETGISYLKGTNHDRVQRVRLRGEYSDGVTIDPEWVCKKIGVDSTEDIPRERDLSELLGIEKYEAPIPAHMSGEVARLDTVALNVRHWYHHDVEHFGIYANEFVDGEEVMVTEKIHGSQFVGYRSSEGVCVVTSKGNSGKELVLKESEDNWYWQVAHHSNIFDILANDYPESNMQIFGEGIPIQKGFFYGQTKPTLRIFRVIENNKEVKREAWSDSLKELGVPVLFTGRLDKSSVAMYAKGMENVSGKSLHIREGIVLSPMVPRRSSKGFALYLKIINPKFKDSDEFIS